MAKPSIETVINRAWEAYKKNWVSICIAILLIGLIEGVLVLLGILPMLMLYFSMAVTGMSSSEVISTLLAEWPSLMFSLAFAAIFLIAALLVGLALNGGLVGMLVQALRKKKISYNTMFSIARARWKSFVGAGIILMIITLLMAGVFLGPGFLLITSGQQVAGAFALLGGTLLMIPVAFVIGILFAFVYISIVADRLGAIPAIKASVRFGWRNFWTTLLILIVFAVLGFLAGLVNAATYIGGTAIAYFIISPLRVLSLAALYLGRKKGRR